jgi:hypothetical protein
MQDLDQEQMSSGPSKQIFIQAVEATGRRK